MVDHASDHASNHASNHASDHASVQVEKLVSALTKYRLTAKGIALKDTLKNNKKRRGEIL